VDAATLRSLANHERNASISAFHHLDRDAEFLIELPERIEILNILVDQQGLR
jgi:hypothetical protein